MMQITGIILAGGESSRMGADKALMFFQGRTLLENAIELCNTLCEEVLISSGNPDHRQFGKDIVSDELQDCGPMSGIYSCLKQSA